MPITFATQAELVKTMSLCRDGKLDPARALQMLMSQLPPKPEQSVPERPSQKRPADESVESREPKVPKTVARLSCVTISIRALHDMI